MPRRPRPGDGVGWVPGSIFAILTIAVAANWTPLVDLDRQVAAALVCTNPPSAWVSWWKAVSTVGQPLVFQVLSVASGVALWIAGRRRTGVFCALAVVGASLLSTITKAIIERPRPVTDGLFTDAHGSSYPSGHAVASFAAAGALALAVRATPGRRREGPRRFPPIAVAVVVTALLVAVLIAASRLALGVHYPADVLGGWLMAAVWLYGLQRVVFGAAALSPPRRTGHALRDRDRPRRRSPR